jgi:hypothetical protein
MRLHGFRTNFLVAALVATLAFGAFGTEAALATPGGDNISSAVTTGLPLVNVAGSLDSTTTDCRDVFKIYLGSGKTLDASVDGTGTENLDLDLVLYRPNATSINETATPRAMWSVGASSKEHFTFMAAVAGYYYLDVHAWAGAGDYTLNARIIPTVPFSIGSLTLPKKAKKGAQVRVSAMVTPGYNGLYSPVWFQFQRYEKGKYRQKAEKLATGYRNPGAASSELFYRYRFAKKGKWRVRAEFWDEAHKSKFTKYKNITIR